LESSYKACLAYEMINDGLIVELEKPMPLIYKEVRLDVGYRLDLFVDIKLLLKSKLQKHLQTYI
jgi:GxxExxY protein